LLATVSALACAMAFTLPGTDAKSSEMNELPRDRTFWADLLRRIARRTRGRDDAEDLLHAAFIRLETYRAQHHVENPTAFLVQTAANIGIDVDRHDRLISEAAVDATAYEIVDGAPLQDEVVAARARLQRVREGIALLSPRTREVFLMHRIDGLKYREIASRLGVSQSAVEKHIAKAALFLAEWVEGW
jgi:RNA polymerase sigma factor (sigma-70 family)